MLLAGSLGSAALAQTAPAAAAPGADAAGTLPTVTVRDTAEPGAPTNSKTELRTTRTQIGKGNQELRDIPQSVTVFTESSCKTAIWTTFAKCCAPPLA